MTLREDWLQEAVEARKAAPDSRSFVRARAREQVLRRKLQESADAEPERWSSDEIHSIAADLGIDLGDVDVSDISEWIQDAISKPGQLHRDLGVPPDKTIPDAALQAAAKQKGKVGARARLAIRLKAMAKKKKKAAKK